jgi:hypothetical protein
MHEVIANLDHFSGREARSLRRQARQNLQDCALPPVRRPGKMFYATQNFPEHVDEMLDWRTPRRS